jgi:hypothetical protein
MFFLTTLSSTWIYISSVECFQTWMYPGSQWQQKLTAFCLITMRSWSPPIYQSRSKYCPSQLKVVLGYIWSFSLCIYLIAEEECIHDDCVFCVHVCMCNSMTLFWFKNEIPSRLGQQSRHFSALFPVTIRSVMFSINTLSGEEKK